MELKKYLEIARLHNCAIAGIGVFVGYAIANHSIAITTQLGTGILAAFAITAAGNAINDYFDAEIDLKLGKGKIAKNQLSVLLFSALLFSAGILLSLTINIQAFAIASIVSGLLILYSSAMQSYKFLGNYVVAAGTALTLVFGAAIAQRYDAIFLLALAAFLANVAREIIKDTEDIEGDRGIKNTLPMLISFGGIKKTIFLLYLGAIAIGIVAHEAGIMRGIWYIVLFGLSAVLFVASYAKLSQRNFSSAQKFSKYAMIVALGAFLAGSI
ncbi:MAG TPA: UbiA family prenyltransferase [archaeon]|nr:UbiA family prenyltransferase [archaeon]